MRAVVRAVTLRSVALPAVPAFVVVVVADLALRPSGWTHEWYWTVDSFSFVTILLAPLVAGIATWDGARWAPATESARSQGRSAWILASAVLPAGVCSSAVYLCGLIAACVRTSSSGTPGIPGVGVLATAIPGVAVLFLAASAGAVIGWLSGRSLAAPAVGVATFAVFLCGYTMLPQNVLRIGGATGSLLSLAPRPFVQALQVAFDVGAGVAVSVVAWSLRSYQTQRSAPSAAVAIAAILGLLLAATSGGRFVGAEPDVACEGTAPEVCLAPGYESIRASVSTVSADPFAVFAAAGYDPPRRLTQNVFDDRVLDRAHRGTTAHVQRRAQRARRVARRAGLRRAGRRGHVPAVHHRMVVGGIGDRSKSFLRPEHRPGGRARRLATESADRCCDRVRACSVRFVTILVRRHHVQWIMLLVVVEVCAARTMRGAVGVVGRGDGAEWVVGPLLAALPALFVAASGDGHVL